MKIYCRIIFSILLISFMFRLLGGIVQSDQNINESLLQAIYSGDIPLIEKLLRAGADVNASLREDMSSPLAEAAYIGNIAVVDYLIKKGAKLEGTQKFPNSPMYFAIYKGHLSVVKRFLDLGVDPNYSWPNKDGGTLLIEAVQDGQIEIVKLLAQRGANVDFCGNGNLSPLYRAIIYDHFNIFEFLLNKGACLNAQDRLALSAVEWTEVERDKKYIELLKKNGCDIFPSKGITHY